MAPPPLNIMLPLGGLGVRFKNEGWQTPKPLINLSSRPMIFWLLDNLNIGDDDVCYVGLSVSLEREYGIAKMLREEYAEIKFVFTLLYFDTRGAAETLYSMLASMEPERLEHRTISLDCDTIYFTDVLSSFRALNSSIGACYYFHDKRGDRVTNPIFSYIEFSPSSEQIVEIKEKVAISKNANTGAYAFSSAEILKEEVRACIDRAVGTKGEYYTSSVISSLISRGSNFVGIYVNDFACVGTPKQLVEFIMELKDGRRLPKSFKKCTIELPTEDSFKALAEELTLAGHEVKFVESMEVKDFLSFLKGIGWAMSPSDKNTPIPLSTPPPPPPLPQIPPTFHESRPFNSITIEKHPSNGGLVVVKKGPADMIKGERVWFETLPSHLKKYTPALLPLPSPADDTSLKLELVDGVTFSNLLLNKCITVHRLSLLFKALKDIHQTSPPISVPPLESVCKNYADKVQQRYNDNRPIYEATNPTSEHLFSFLVANLCHYEATHSHSFSNRIHGDPVFTNVLLTRTSTIKLVDPRGTLGSVEAVCGDQMYDFTKVFQSLSGYDYILAGVPPDEEYLESLKRVFWDETECFNLDPNYVSIITASHFFSIIPLHNEQHHRSAFFNVAVNLVGEDYREYKANITT